MKTLEAIFNSTNANRYDMIFPAAVLFSALRQCWDTGLPSFLSHDHHRLAGWTQPLALYLQPGVGLLAGEVLVPETEEERTQISESYFKLLSKRIHDHAGPHESTLKQGLQNVLCGDETMEFCECAALRGKGLAERKFPALFSQRDKDGLIPIKSLVPLGPGLFDAGDGLILFAHPFFRRALSRLNTLNEPFLGRFQKIAAEQSASLTARIAVDPDLVGLKRSVMSTIELEYWWGPKFSNDLGRISYGVTRHEADPRTKCFHGISRTEFGWYEQNENPTFECEEVRDIETLGAGKGKFGCRFVHSIVNPERKTAFHLDGAIRLYDEDGMIARSEVDFKDAGRKTDYTKLWRVDGEISLESWKELISHYFRDNHLVGEYFGGAEEVDVALRDVQVLQPDPIRTLVPCDLRPEDGLRLSVSLHAKRGGTEEVEIESFDALRSGDERIPYMEADTVDLVKTARRLGLEIALPQGLKSIAFEDLVLNLPLIVHRGPNFIRNSEITTAALRTLCESWSNRNKDELFSFSLGLEFPEYELRLSWAGHVQAFHRFFENRGTLLPVSLEAIPDWTNSILTLLSQLFRERREEPMIWRLLESSGILTLSRRLLQPGEYSLDPENGEVSVSRELHEAMTKYSTEVTRIYVIEDSHCSAGHPDYFSCPCIKSLEDDVVQHIDKASLVGFCLTNRSAW